MIEVQNLTRYYGHHAAVAGLSFSIQDHEIVGFLGLNGAGKSTTLKILAGLLLPSSGTVSLDGVDVVQAPDSLRSQIGYLPEDAPLYLDMRVRDFVAYVGQLKGMSNDQVNAHIDGVLDRAGWGSIGGFRGYRIEIEYPATPWCLTMTCPIHKD